MSRLSATVWKPAANSINIPLMRIVIIGAAGQLGTALQACLTGEVTPLTHAQIEITNPEQVDQVLSALKPDCVINAAAYNFVDRAEDEVIQAAPGQHVRPEEPGPMVREGGRHARARQHRLRLRRRRRANAAAIAKPTSPSPSCAYALSKLRGEKLVEAECPKHFIVRTCGLYGNASTAGKGNFVKTMRRLAQEGKDLSIVNDQHCTPSYAVDIAARHRPPDRDRPIRPVPRHERRRHDVVRVRPRNLPPVESQPINPPRQLGGISAKSETPRLQRARLPQTHRPDRRPAAGVAGRPRALHGASSTEPALAAGQSSAALPSSHIFTIFGSKRATISTRSCCWRMTSSIRL